MIDITQQQLNRRTACHTLATIFLAGCSSGGNPVQQPAQQAASMPGVAELWGRIEAWLSQHAPKIRKNLNPPATQADLAKIEKAFGAPLPAEWKELYLVHNGMNSDGNFGSLFHGMEFLPLEQVGNELAGLQASDVEAQPVQASDRGIRREHMLNPKWLPFAHDGGDTLLRIDLDPAPDGTVGQVIFTDHAYDTVIRLSGSLREFLADFVNDLESGKYSLDPQALADGKQFLVCDKEIDVVNWSHSQRWQHLKSPKSQR